MALSYSLLFGAMLGYSLLGILHKVADRPNCRPNVLAALLLFWGGVLTTLYMLVFEKTGLRLPPKAALIGASGGLFAAVALVSFQSALRYGKISTSWLILQLSVSIPLLVSLVLYGERLNPAKVIGVGLVLLAIVMLWLDKRTEREAVAPIDDATHATPIAKANWLPLIIVAFIANGLAASSPKVLSETFADQDLSWPFLAALYWTGFAFLAIFYLVRENRPNRLETGLAFVMSVASIAGNLLLAKALFHGVKGAIGYPIANGGSLFIVVAAGLLLFKERLTRWGVSGIVVGIIAVLVLLSGGE